MFRTVGSSGWQCSPMEPQGNDRWKGSFTAGLPGRYEYTIKARVDHFQTWKKGLSKKIDAGQDVSLDLQIGALLLDAGAKRAGSDDAARACPLFAARIRSE